MLDVLRRNAGSWLIKTILIFIALTFIWWGVGNYGREDPNVAATVGDESISMTEVGEMTANLERSYREMYGPAFTPEIAQALGLKKQAVETLIRRRILLAEAEKMGIRATDDEVQRDIATTPAFQSNGQFREDIYRQLLAQNRLNPSQYEDSKRTEIALKKLEGVLTSGALVPESEAKQLFLLSARKIRVLVATGDPAKMKGLPEPSQGEIAAKYEQVKESFRLPARVKLSVAAFTPELFSRDVHPSEAEVKAYYEGNPEKFRTEEQRLVSRIVLPYTPQTREVAQKKAAQAMTEATKGRDEFEAAAKKLGVRKTPEAWMTRKEAGPALANALFQAPADTIVGPADQGGAFVLAHVSRIRFPEALPLSQVRDRVADQLRLEKGKDIATIKAYEAQPKAAAAKNMAGTVAAYGVKASETGWVGGEGSQDAPPKVVQDALVLAAGEVGPVKTIGDRHYLYQVLAKEDSRIPPLEQVRPQVLAQVVKDQQAAASRAAVQKAVSGAKSAAELEANAKKAGLAAETTGWFAPLAENPPGELAQVKDIRKDLALLSPKSPVSTKIYASGERILAVAFLGEQPATEAEWAARKDAFLRALREQEKNNVIEGFITDRRKQWKVEIKPEALK